MNAEVWGPHFWFTFHTISMAYPIHANTVTQKKYYEFITNLPLFLPHPVIGNFFAKLLDEYPVAPYLNTRASFVKWLHFIHNKINNHLGKKEMSFYDYINLYNKYYEPKEKSKKQDNKWKKYYIEISICTLLLLIVFYCYKK